MDDVHIQYWSVVLREVRRVLAEFEAKKVSDAAAQKVEAGGRNERAEKVAERTTRNLWRMEKRLKRLQLGRLARTAESEEKLLGGKRRRRPTDGSRRGGVTFDQTVEGADAIIANAVKMTALIGKIGSARRLRAPNKAKLAGPGGVRKA